MFIFNIYRVHPRSPLVYNVSTRPLTEADLLIRDNCLICLDEFRVGDIVPDIPHPCLQNNSTIFQVLRLFLIFEIRAMIIKEWLHESLVDW